MTLPYDKSHIPIGEDLPKGCSFWDYTSCSSGNEINLVKRAKIAPSISHPIVGMRLKKMKQ